MADERETERPLRNRVDPYGELIATPERGLVFGNRGCLHDADGEIRRSWVGRRWIACRLRFRDRQRPLLEPNRYTGLFLLDEATAFAAGQRPCAECRHADYRRFADWWEQAHGERGADLIDTRLHRERVVDGRRRLHPRPADALPTGTMLDLDGRAWLVVDDTIRRWTPAGYAETSNRPHGTATVLTPPSLVALLSAGWADAAVPLLHPSAG